MKTTNRLHFAHIQYQPCGHSRCGLGACFSVFDSGQGNHQITVFLFLWLPDIAIDLLCWSKASKARSPKSFAQAQHFLGGRFGTIYLFIFWFGGRGKGPGRRRPEQGGGSVLLAENFTKFWMFENMLSDLV